MAQQIKTDRQAKTITTPGRHGIGVTRANLRVQIRNGKITRSYQWTPKGHPGVSIGSPNAVSLKAAREIARSLNDAFAKGIDPAAERRATVVTFGMAADACIESLKAGWNNPVTLRGWTRCLVKHAAPLRDKPVASIDTDAVLSVLRPLWGRKLETANKLRQRIERVLDFSKAKGWRPLDSINCAAWRGHLENLLPKQPRLVRGHHPALPYAEMPAFMADVTKREGLVWRGLELLALTACRYGQVAGAEWSEFDLEQRLWRIPAGRAKRKQSDAPHAHIVPLSDAALAVLARVPRSDGEPRLFAGLGRDDMRRAMAATRPGYTCHGLRSCFRDWGGDRSRFPDALLEECIGHAVGSPVRRAYRRGAQDYTQRAEVFAAWGAYLNGGSVLPLRAVAS